MTLSITAILIFQGCVLIHTRILPDQACPEYPMDCFVFNGTSYQPISENITFRCDPNNNTQFPSGLTDPTAMCFGWIIQLQTTKNVLDQLGVCTGLLGLFSALLAVIVYLGKSIKTIVLCTLFIAACLAAIVLLIFFKWSFSALTYAVLLLGAALGLFGIILYCVLPKRKKRNIDNQPIQSNPNARNLSPVQIKSYPPPPTSAYRSKYSGRSSKVTPK